MKGYFRTMFSCKVSLISCEQTNHLKMSFTNLLDIVEPLHRHLELLGCSIGCFFDEGMFVARTVFPIWYSTLSRICL